MADGKTVVIQHRTADQADMSSEAPLPEYGAQQSSGGFMDWVREHKLLVTVVLGGAGILLLIYFYNKGQTGADTTDTTGSTDTSGTDPSMTSGLGTSGYGAPDWSPVIGALSGLQQQDQQILSQLQSTQSAQAQSQAAPQAAPPTASSAPPPDWQPQPLGSTPGLSSSQEAAKQRQQYIDFHVNKNCGKLKGTARQNCVNHWTQKAGARHPNVGGAFTSGSSLSLRSMHMREPSWRSGDHQGIHIGRMN